MRIALQAMQSEIQRLAVNANLHDKLGLTTPALVQASKRRQQLQEAIAALQPQPKPQADQEQVSI
jgi:hypothetical protein